MAEYQPPEGPFALQGPSSATPASLLRNSAASIRRTFGAIAKTSGIAGFGDLAPSATGADKNLSVATGAAWMKGTQATDQGVYYGYNAPSKAIDMLTANPAHATLARIDLVVAVVEDTFYGGATDNWYLRQVVGTPNASPVAPAAPANSFVICSVLVPAAVVVINPANITDLRTVAYYGAGQPWKFYRTLLGAIAASIAIPLPAAIPGLDDLAIDFYAREDGAAAADNMLIRFNADAAAANYYRDHQVTSGVATAVPVENLGAALSNLGGLITGATATANFFAQGRILIKNYAAAVGDKTAMWDVAYSTSLLTGAQVNVKGKTRWATLNTPLTRIDLFPGTGNFIVGSLVAAKFE